MIDGAFLSILKKRKESSANNKWLRGGVDLPILRPFRLPSCSCLVKHMKECLHTKGKDKGIRGHLV